MTRPGKEYRIATQEDIAHEGRHWPTTRYTASIDGEYLKTKDGRLRKFKTRHAARAAAFDLVQTARAADPGARG